GCLGNTGFFCIHYGFNINKASHLHTAVTKRFETEDEAKTCEYM
ncbi:unnamed protein product, partial [Brassica oleracea]